MGQRCAGAKIFFQDDLAGDVRALAEGSQERVAGRTAEALAQRARYRDSPMSLDFDGFDAISPVSRKGLALTLRAPGVP